MNNLKHRRFKKPVTLGLTLALCAGLCLPALALGAEKTISVLTGVNLYVNDVEFHPTDANGAPVEVFVYNGTTYLPVRAISNALGQDVTWDGKTSSVYIGKHAAGETAAAKLYELEHFYSEKMDTVAERKTVKDNLGVDHDTVRYNVGNYNTDCFVTYKLNGQYTRMAGTYFLAFDYRDKTAKRDFAVYGDGKELWRGTVQGGVEPIPFNIDLTGVLELKLVFRTDNYWEDDFWLGDVTLYK